MSNINGAEKKKAIFDYINHFVAKTIVIMNYKDNKNTNKVGNKPKIRLMYSILIKGKLYTAYQDPFVWYYGLQNDNDLSDIHILNAVMSFCKDAWLNPEKFNMKDTKYESDILYKLSFDDFEKPEHKAGEPIDETEDYVTTAITEAEFKELFGFAYPF